MLCVVIIADYVENHAKAIQTLYEKTVALMNVNADGEYSNHCNLRC